MPWHNIFALGSLSLWLRCKRHELKFSAYTRRTQRVPRCGKYGTEFFNGNAFRCAQAMLRWTLSARGRRLRASSSLRLTQESRPSALTSSPISQRSDRERRGRALHGCGRLRLAKPRLGWALQPKGAAAWAHHLRLLRLRVRHGGVLARRRRVPALPHSGRLADAYVQKAGNLRPCDITALYAAVGRSSILHRLASRYARGAGTNWSIRRYPSLTSARSLQALPILSAPGDRVEGRYIARHAPAAHSRQIRLSGRTRGTQRPLWGFLRSGWSQGCSPGSTSHSLARCEQHGLCAWRAPPTARRSTLAIKCRTFSTPNMVTRARNTRTHAAHREAHALHIYKTAGEQWFSESAQLRMEIKMDVNVMMLPPVITNKDNICFASSVVQCLLNRPVFTSMLESVMVQHQKGCSDCQQG